MVGEGHLYWLSPRQPSSECGVSNPVIVRPVSKAFGLAVMCYPTTRALVPSLLAGCRPTTVIRSVSFGIVDSVERVARGLIAHVGQKVCKTVPAFANGYASSAVIFEKLVVRVFAAVSHARPANIGARNAIGRMTMFGAAFYSGFRAKTSARLGLSVSECSPQDKARSSAIAPANPLSLSAQRVFAPRKNGPSVKLFPGKVYHSHDKLYA